MLSREFWISILQLVCMLPGLLFVAVCIFALQNYPEERAIRFFVVVGSFIAWQYEIFLPWKPSSIKMLFLKLRKK